jgi:uncharacterized membrane protein YeaQ/YmgE (transglycosylase-associated protein family)
MKKVLKWIWEGIKWFWYTFPKYVLYIIILALIGGYFTKWITHNKYYFNKVFIIILFGLVGCVIGFIWLRQLYWWITKTGDFKKKNIKSM